MSEVDKAVIRRLSWPEAPGEVWVGIDWSWSAIGTKNANGSHKEWIIVCLKDSSEYKTGDVLNDTFDEWYQARYTLTQLVKKSLGS